MKSLYVPCSHQQSSNFFYQVDAALDNINLRKVCNYIRRRSQTDFQCIVISLKDMFYEHSQSLVGTCRDVGTSSSRTMTLDLTKFDHADDHTSATPVPTTENQKRRRATTGEEGNSPSKGKRHRVSA